MNNSEFLSPDPGFTLIRFIDDACGMITNSIPKGRMALINLGHVAFEGATIYGEGADLQHNNAARIGADLHDLTGDPANPSVPGKQARLGSQLVAGKGANAAKRAAISAGREFCRLAINLLRPSLGNGWNTAWKAAGFHLPSLALPRQPVALLTALRSYFAANPAQENAQADVTAAMAAARAEAINAAIVAAAEAKKQRITFKRERDEALKKLRRRLSGLRAELAQVLEPEDGRWYEFGFRRPADGRQPEPVTEVTATPTAPGVVLVGWPASRRAKDYRVTWTPQNPAPDSEPNAEPAKTVFATQTKCALADLPLGESIIIAVSARNSTGETPATRVIISATARGTAPLSPPPATPD